MSLDYLRGAIGAMGIGGAEATGKYQALFEEMQAAHGDPPPRDIVEWGSCRNYDPSVFFPNPGERGTEAKRICKEDCAVYLECREWALSAPASLFGIWGGMSQRERQDILWPHRAVARAERIERDEERQRQRDYAHQHKLRQIAEKRAAAEAKRLEALGEQDRAAELVKIEKERERRRAYDQRRAKLQQYTRPEVKFKTGTTRTFDGKRAVWFEAAFRSSGTSWVRARTDDPAKSFELLLAKVQVLAPRYVDRVVAKRDEVLANMTVDGIMQAV